MGLMDRLAGERPQQKRGETASGDGTLAKMIESARAQDEDGAGAIAWALRRPWPRLRRSLEDALGIPVIDPTQAAVAMALVRCSFRVTSYPERLTFRAAGPHRHGW